MTANVAPRVAVIGAGNGGVCTAKQMIQAGYDVTVFEAGSYVGGLWVWENDNGRSQAYKNLSIISSRRFTKFKDWEFDDQTPRFPTHRDMHRYVHSYAEHFGVLERTRFRSPVTAIEPLFSRGGSGPWRVRLADGTSGEFDAVIVATGHLNEPLHVEEFRTQFTGRYLHSSEYREADPFVDHRVCVVGVGNSGVDIASDVCSVADRTVLVARSGVVIQPKVVFGMAWSDIAIGLRKRWIPAAVRNRIMNLLIYLVHGDLRRLGIQRPKGRTHPTLSESIIADIEYNRVAVKPGIRSIDGQKITFEDGTIEEFDDLVAATGYRVHLPFVPEHIVPVNGNHVDLFKRIFVPGWPGLYFVGMLNPLSTLNRIFEEQAELLVHVIGGDVRFPSEQQMLDDIADKNRRAAAIYTDSPRHEMEEPDFLYVDELHSLRDGNLGKVERRTPLGRLRRILARG